MADKNGYKFIIQNLVKTVDRIEERLDNIHADVKVLKLKSTWMSAFYSALVVITLILIKVAF